MRVPRVECVFRFAGPQCSKKCSKSVARRISVFRLSLPLAPAKVAPASNAAREAGSVVTIPAADKSPGCGRDGQERNPFFAASQPGNDTRAPLSCRDRFTRKALSSQMLFLKTTLHWKTL